MYFLLLKPMLCMGIDIIGVLIFFNNHHSCIHWIIITMGIPISIIIIKRRIVPNSSRKVPNLICMQNRYHLLFIFGLNIPSTFFRSYPPLSKPFILSTFVLQLVCDLCIKYAVSVEKCWTWTE